MVIVRAPLRISFGGGGTDLAAYYTRFGGLVVSAAITRYCYVVANEPPDGGIRLNSADYRVWETYRRGEIPPVREPLALPKAAIACFADRGLGERGIDLFLASEVPPGTGLGSSSAMAVGLVRALAAHLPLPLDAAAVAELACHVEIERLGMPIGKQDHYASAFGGLNAIAFTAGGVNVMPLDVPADVVAALSSRLLLFATGQTRDSAAILRRQRTDTSTNPAVIAALHRLKALAAEMREALETADLDRFGILLGQSWCEKKSLSRRVSTRAIDDWYEAARAAGALGGKITGAGGGGFLLLYCPPRRQGAVRVAMAQAGLRELTFDVDGVGVQVLVDQVAGADRRPAQGTVRDEVIGVRR
jgi:D-glycero-alpha-D-manno-heptose-7-phosphate kinase